MKRFIFVFIVSLFYINSFSQGSVTLRDEPFNLNIEKEAHLLNRLDSNEVYQSLNSDQKEAVYWVNYVRTKPEDFHNKVLVPFLAQFPEVKSSYSKSLSSYLLSASPKGILLPSVKLTKVAADHATDLGKNGMQISHKSSKGLSFQQRMNNAGYYSSVAENIYEGKRSALEALIFLLIDTGIPNVGHRKNIMMDDMKYIGVSFYPIKKRPNMYFFVQDFSAD